MQHTNCWTEENMSRARILPSEAILLAWVTEGLKHHEMAVRVYEQTGHSVARSTISAALSRAGLTNRIRYKEDIPWKRIKEEHNHHYAVEMLRLWARTKQGDPTMSENRQKRLESWLDTLEDMNAVVAYVDNSPDGFYYVLREPRDGLGYIRLPDQQKSHADTASI
jgi:hypothetical protein